MSEGELERHIQDCGLFHCAGEPGTAACGAAQGGRGGEVREVAAPADEPQFVELRARCRAAGVQLSRGKDFDGTPIFIASRWGLAKQFLSLPALAAWLEWTGQGRAAE